MWSTPRAPARPPRRTNWNGIPTGASSTPDALARRRRRRLPVRRGRRRSPLDSTRTSASASEPPRLRRHCLSSASPSGEQSVRRSSAPSAVGYYGDTGDHGRRRVRHPRVGLPRASCAATGRPQPIRPGRPARGSCICVPASSSPARRPARAPAAVRAPRRGRSARQRAPVHAWISLADEVAAIRFLIESDLSRAGEPHRPRARCATPSSIAAMARLMHRPAVIPVPGFALRIALGEFSAGRADRAARVAGPPHRMRASSSSIRRSTTRCARPVQAAQLTVVPAVGRLAVSACWLAIQVNLRSVWWPSTCRANSHAQYGALARGRAGTNCTAGQRRGQRMPPVPSRELGAPAASHAPTSTPCARRSSPHPAGTMRSSNSDVLREQRSRHVYPR